MTVWQHVGAMLRSIDRRLLQVMACGTGTLCYVYWTLTLVGVPWGLRFLIMMATEVGVVWAYWADTVERDPHVFLCGPTRSGKERWASWLRG